MLLIVLTIASMGQQGTIDPRLFDDIHSSLVDFEAAFETYEARYREESLSLTPFIPPASKRAEAVKFTQSIDIKERFPFARRWSETQTEYADGHTSRLEHLQFWTTDTTTIIDEAAKSASIRDSKPEDRGLATTLLNALGVRLQYSLNMSFSEFLLRNRSKLLRKTDEVVDNVACIVLSIGPPCEYRPERWAATQSAQLWFAKEPGHRLQKFESYRDGSLYSKFVNSDFRGVLDEKRKKTLQVAHEVRLTSPRWDCIWRVEHVRLNPAFAAPDMEPQITKGFRVRDSRTGEEYVVGGQAATAELVRHNTTVAREVTQMPPIQGSQDDLRADRSPIRYWLWSLVGLSALLLALALYMLKRRRRNAA